MYILAGRRQGFRVAFFGEAKKYKQYSESKLALMSNYLIIYLHNSLKSITGTDHKIAWHAGPFVHVVVCPNPIGSICNVIEV